MYNYTVSILYVQQYMYDCGEALYIDNLSVMALLTGSRQQAIEDGKLLPCWDRGTAGSTAHGGSPLPPGLLHLHALRGPLCGACSWCAHGRAGASQRGEIGATGDIKQQSFCSLYIGVLSVSGNGHV